MTKLTDLQAMHLLATSAEYACTVDKVAPEALVENQTEHFLMLQVDDLALKVRATTVLRC